MGSSAALIEREQNALEETRARRERIVAALVATRRRLETSIAAAGSRFAPGPASAPATFEETYRRLERARDLHDRLEQETRARIIRLRREARIAAAPAA